MDVHGLAGFNKCGHEVSLYQYIIGSNTCLCAKSVRALHLKADGRARTCPEFETLPDISLLAAVFKSHLESMTTGDFPPS